MEIRLDEIEMILKCLDPVVVSRLVGPGQSRQ